MLASNLFDLPEDKLPAVKVYQLIYIVARTVNRSQTWIGKKERRFFLGVAQAGHLVIGRQPFWLKTIIRRPSLADQVKGYKYIIDADGHCAALRLRQLLASGSVVLWVESNQIEWFYPLLVPFVHYIPVRFDAHEAAHDPLPDLIEKIA
ncbi:MAG: lipopolysaccharide-modifying enzyme [Trebouxia sp. A1-2]|nr:MAG: lipopolysaccharide-modifying enzyme [Trebouxia sp. A1-2]